MAPCGHVRASLVDKRAIKVAKYSQGSMVMVVMSNASGRPVTRRTNEPLGLDGTRLEPGSLPQRSRSPQDLERMA